VTYHSDNQVKWIVIHYSATPVENDVPMATIDEWHRQRGFREIGYHYYIRKNGQVELGRDLSQPGRFEQGAHSKGENDASIGICYEGGVYAHEPKVGRDTRTQAQIETMIRLIDDLRERFPGAKVEGHRDMPGAATQCPGFDAHTWWEQIQKERLRSRPWWAGILDLLRSLLRGRVG